MRIARRPPPDLFKLSTNVWTAPYWQAAQRRVLVAACCAECGRFRMPPTPFCPQCQSQRIDWRTLSGLGTLYSYTVVERAILPGMQAHLPYVPAVITLDDAGGVRLISNLVEVDIERIQIGMPVRVVWDPQPDGSAVIARFVPVGWEPGRQISGLAPG